MASIQTPPPFLNLQELSLRNGELGQHPGFRESAAEYGAADGQHSHGSRDEVGVDYSGCI